MNKYSTKNWVGMLVYLVSRLLIALLFTFILLEFVLRVLSKFNLNINQFTYNPRRTVNFDNIDNLNDLMTSSSCQLVPGSFWMGEKVNAKGFADVDREYRKNDNVFRIVSIGDSFTVAAVPRRFNYTNLIEKNLNSTQNSKQIENINLGVSCIGPRFYQKMYELEGKRYSADLVIIYFFIGNDFTDNQYNYDHFKEIKNNWMNDRSLADKYFDKSYFVTMLKNLKKVNQHQLLAKNKNNIETILGDSTVSYFNYVDNNATYTPEEYLQIEASRLSVYSKEKFEYAKPDAAINDILNLKKGVDHERNNFLVVIIPDELQLNNELLYEVLKYSGETIGSIDIHLPQNLIKQKLDNNDVAYIDLLREFEKSDVNNLYKTRDTHFNLKGNQITADIITKYISQNYFH